MTGPPSNATVLNTTVLSNFAQVDHVELLLDLPRLVTVAAVQEELEAGLKLICTSNTHWPCLEIGSQYLLHLHQQRKWKRNCWKH